MSDSSKMSSFPRFLDLPQEIRTVIWKLALPDPRIVLLKQVKLRPIDSGSQDDDDDGDVLLGFKSDLPVPVLLLVCRESHAIASRYYTKTFTCTNGETHIAIPQTYFDYEHDILYLDQKGSFRTAENGHSTFYNHLFDLDREEVKRVRNLALWIDLAAEGIEDIERTLAEILGCFGGVARFTLVVDTFMRSPPFDPMPSEEQSPALEFMGKGVHPWEALMAYKSVTASDLKPKPIQGNRMMSYVELDMVRLEEERLKCCQGGHFSVGDAKDLIQDRGPGEPE
jgi:hypothetical protein